MSDPTFMIDGEEAQSVAGADEVTQPGIIAHRIFIGGRQADDGRAQRRVLVDGRLTHKVVEARGVQVLVDVDHLDGQVGQAAQRRSTAVLGAHRQVEQLALFEVERPHQAHRPRQPVDREPLHRFRRVTAVIQIHSNFIDFIPFHLI